MLLEILRNSYLLVVDEKQKNHEEVQPGKSEVSSHCIHSYGHGFRGPRHRNVLTIVYL